MILLQEDGSPAQPSSSVDVDANNFMVEVVEKSRSVPVLVDFWAPWCEPCKSLTPILESISQEYGEDLHFVKVNIDENQPLAGQFGIRSVPTVYLVKDGDVVDGFMGAMPKEGVKQFLSKHITSDNVSAPDQVDLLLQQGNVAQAIALLKSEDSDDSKIRLADIHLQMNDLENARDSLKNVKDATGTPEFKQVTAKLKLIESIQNAPSERKLRKRIQQNPKDWEAQIQLAEINLAQGQFETALESLLEIVRQDRSFNDDAARKTLIKAFDLLGSDNELVSKYRRLLAIALN